MLRLLPGLRYMASVSMARCPMAAPGDPGKLCGIGSGAVDLANLSDDLTHFLLGVPGHFALRLYL